MLDNLCLETQSGCWMGRGFLYRDKINIYHEHITRNVFCLKLSQFNVSTYHRSHVFSSLAAVYHSVDTDLHTHLGLGTEWAGTLLLHTGHTHSCSQTSVEEVAGGMQRKVRNDSGGYRNEQHCCIKLSDLEYSRHSPDLHNVPYNQVHCPLMLASCLQKPHQSSLPHLGGFGNHLHGDC